MEACGGSHYWSRELSQLGHTVRMMAPAFVKPCLKRNKNDRNDAEAICEAVQRASMRFVSVKTPEQQSVLHLHHGRRLLEQQRVALSNHLRSVLLEYAIAIPVGDTILMQQLPELLEDADNELPILSRQLQAWHQQSETSRRLETIPGIGLLTASALAAALGEGKDF